MRGAVEGPVTAHLPASALQLHPSATLYIDPGAASELAHTAEYRKRMSAEGELDGRL